MLFLRGRFVCLHVQLISTVQSATVHNMHASCFTGVWMHTYVPSDPSPAKQNVKRRCQMISCVRYVVALVPSSSTCSDTNKCITVFSLKKNGITVAACMHDKLHEVARTCTCMHANLHVLASSAEESPVKPLRHVARRVRRPVPGARRACLRRTCRTTVLRYLAKSLRDDEHVDIISVVDHWILLASVRRGGARVRRSKAVLVRYVHFACILILQ